VLSVLLFIIQANERKEDKKSAPEKGADSLKWPLGKTAVLEKEKTAGRNTRRPERSAS
jgi:hypothetical protein